MRERTASYQKFERKNYGVTGSRSSEKEKDRSEEEQENLRNKKDSQTSGLLRLRFWGSKKLGILGS
jgi:hypothetical protein